MHTHDVVVIGAGLAGLRCALELARHGREVLVLEASDRVGGRQRSDRIDGFLLDRGFHVLNPAYPALRGVADLGALGIRAFPAGVRVTRARRVVTLAHPIRHPGLIPATLTSGLLSLGDIAALARWSAPLLRPPAMATATDVALGAAWDRAGLGGALRDEVLVPFFSGVVGGEPEETSNTYVQLLVRSFALGRPGVPEAGIAALPRRLAAKARDAGVDLRVDRPVQRLRSRDGGWEVLALGEGRIAASHVVVAVGAESVAGLVDVPVPRTRGLQTWWFAADEPPTSSFLTIDGTRSGPVVNSIVMSHTAPSYALPGRHLVQATCLLDDAARATEAEVRRQLTWMWGSAAAEWELLRRDDIPHALPALPPPMRRRSPSRLGHGLHIAGDHRETPSIQGALVSGLRAARGVLAG